MKMDIRELKLGHLTLYSHYLISERYREERERRREREIERGRERGERERVIREREIKRKQHPDRKYHQKT